MKLFTVFFVLINTSISFSQTEIDYLKVSQELLSNIKNNTQFEDEVKLITNSSLDVLSSHLRNDDQKKAFWINIYNAFIQISLSEKPELFSENNRSDFFSEPRVNIAGEKLSFDDIEHGIIRSSTSKISMGYVKKIFRPDWEQELRTEEVDWRIHFALNCGAKSCPPIAIYNAKDIDKQLDFMTKTYLKEQTKFITESKTAETVVLFSWFRGDFGGLDEVKKILKSYSITPEKPENLEFKTYDWTMLLNNYRQLPEF